MKVCQLSTVEHVYNFLAPLCHALRERGHEVVIACNLEHDGREVRRYLGDGFAHHRIRGARRLGVRALSLDVLALAWYLRRERFDVLHVHGPLVSMQARVAARLAGVPTVISQAHGFYFHAGSRPVARLGLRWLEQVFCRHLTDHLVTVSAEDRALAVARRFRPNPEEIVHVPGVGIDTDRFSPDGDPVARRRLREELGAPADAVVVTFVGRLVAEKGLVELATAFAGLARRDPRPVLWLVGDVLDSERDRGAPDAVGRIVSAAGAADRVRFLGRRTDVPAVLQASDVFTLPSHREGMPVSVMEAMACGLPVVVTDIRGSREAVIHGDCGLIVPARDPAALAAALIGLVEDEVLRRRLGDAARERVLDHYSAAASLAPLLALYRRIDAARGYDSISSGSRNGVPSSETSYPAITSRTTCSSTGASATGSSSATVRSSSC